MSIQPEASEALNPFQAPQSAAAPVAVARPWPVEVWYVLFFLGVMGSLLGGFLLCRGEEGAELQQAIGPGVGFILAGAALAVSGPLLAVARGQNLGFGGAPIVFLMTPLPAAVFALLCWLGSVARKTENAWIRGAMLTAGAAALAYVAVCFAKGWPLGLMKDAPAAVALWPHLLHLGLTLTILSQWPVDAAPAAASPAPIRAVG